MKQSTIEGYPMRQTIAALLLATLLLLSGCGGGGGAAPAPPSAVSGVAAAGLVIAGQVYLKDSAASPRVLTHPTSDGRYSFDVTGLTRPFMLKVVGTVAGGAPYTLYSLAADQGTANLNPLSNLLVAKAAASGDLAGLYDAPDRSGMPVVAAKLGQALAEVRSTLGPLLQSFGAAAVDPITGAYQANGSGLDGMLDVVKIEVAGTGIITITDTRGETAPITQFVKPFSVSGKVAGANGAGLAGVTVSVTPGTLSAVTDGQGSYCISGLGLGAYTITPSRTDVFHAAPVSFVAPSREITISDAANYAFADFSADLAGFTVSGKLTRLSSGAAMPGVVLTLVTKTNADVLLSGGDAVFSTVSDANGAYSFHGIPSGYYEIDPALKDYAFALSAASGTGATADNFLVNAADTTMEFTGRPTSDASGGVKQ